MEISFEPDHICQLYLQLSGDHGDETRQKIILEGVVNGKLTFRGGIVEKPPDTCSLNPDLIRITFESV
ncbi:hypothetical protein M378DRAFT_172697 [Amanita muscaria Koide BX008]|uniref:Uncharacterized protein n=1 Tax=Amanita muscaria (strain Koide BX008) TaxID=946122 RepID=A0A0C2WIF4_AMAMK|nr:hypothetical protein M378DRAFT_172697 [Amanita muscaria Koide BX008]